MAPPTTWVAMLRGINVGATNRVTMPDLRTAVEGLGYDNVRTYVQSGNLVFLQSAPGTSTSAEQVAGLVAGAVKEHFGLEAAVVVRSGRQLGSTWAEGPFVKEGLRPEEAPTSFHVTFLAAPPTEAKWTAAAAEAEGFAPDVCRLVGADIHLHVPGGRYSDSKLTNAWFERKLGLTATTRNWKTVGMLAEMAAG